MSFRLDAPQIWCWKHTLATTNKSWAERGFGGR